MKKQYIEPAVQAAYQMPKMAIMVGSESEQTSMDLLDPPSQEIEQW